MMTVAALDKMMAGIVREDTGCWIWARSLCTAGYGRIISNGTEWLAHRFAYTEMVGPIPDGLVIDHLCRTKTCVNPQHLEPVTNAENIRRGLRGQLVTECAHGHAYTPENTRRTSHGRRTCRTCGEIRNRTRRDARRLARQGA